jgi:hypothetical protein
MHHIKPGNDNASLKKKSEPSLKSKVCRGMHTKKPNVCESRGEAGEQVLQPVHKTS